VSFEGRHPEPATIRFKAGAYEAWAGRSWRQAPGQRRLRKESREGVFRLSPGAAVGRAEIALEPLRSPSLPLPLETLAVDAPTLRLELSDGGALALGGLPGEVYDYVALLGAGPASVASPPAAGAGAGPLATDGVSARMAELAAAWAGEGSASERAARIEQRLHVDYSYTTEFVGRGGASPIEDFLFRDRRGHCEYFASAMVLLLRAQAIPARLVTGFYGAEWSAWETSWVVRQSNAHVWVEAWLPGSGWTTFDPTPPDGLPRPGGGGPMASLRDAWDALVFRWDRWVISYDFEDQVGVLGSLRSWWSDLMRSLAGGRRPGERTPATPGVPGAPGASTPATGAREWARLWPWLLAALAVSAAGAWYVLRRRAAWSAARAYELMRATLAAAGLPVPDALAPLALERLVARRLPAAAQPASRLIGGYLAEVFAGRAPKAARLVRLRADLAAVERAARAGRRSLRREP
jgi:hypothetical protein